jgi:hypothetical protein
MEAGLEAAATDPAAVEVHSGAEGLAAAAGSEVLLGAEVAAQATEVVWVRRVQRWQ